jgi:hypothetical protein
MPRSNKEDKWGNQSVLYGSLKKRVSNSFSGSWKGAAVEKGLEPGDRGIAIVKAITRQLLVKPLQAGKDLA